MFKNPVSLFIGGVAAVVLELAEPRVRSGVWQHTKFNVEPVQRMKRTGLAAMVTVYGARSTAEAMIAGVRRVHDRIGGVTPWGKAYRASDPELLVWVHATAAFGFLEAYARFVAPVSIDDRDRFYAEGQLSAELYGAMGAPSATAEVEALFRAMHNQLEPSDIVFDFLQIMRSAPLLPSPLRRFQHLFVRAAMELVPLPVREVLGLNDSWDLRHWEGKLVRLAGMAADRLIVDASPPVEACRRLRLPDSYLYGRANKGRQV